MVPVCRCCRSTALLPPKHMLACRPVVMHAKIISTRRRLKQLNAIQDHGTEALAIAAAAALGGPPLAKAVFDQLQPKRCQTCLGTGYIICTTCQGRGLVGLSLPGEACSVSSCSECDKRGHLKCDQCNATGITNNWLWQPASDPGWGPRGS